MFSSEIDSFLVTSQFKCIFVTIKLVNSTKNKKAMYKVISYCNMRRVNAFEFLGEVILENRLSCSFENPVQLIICRVCSPCPQLMCVLWSGSHSCAFGRHHWSLMLQWPLWTNHLQTTPESLCSKRKHKTTHDDSVKTDFFNFKYLIVIMWWGGYWLSDITESQIKLLPKNDTTGLSMPDQCAWKIC